MKHTNQKIYVRNKLLLLRKSRTIYQAGGAIVVFGTSHMEIVTSRERNKYLDDGFCSIGAGRGTRSSTGTVRCDNIWGDKREIENKNNHFYSI